MQGFDPFARKGTRWADNTSPLERASHSQSEKKKLESLAAANTTSYFFPQPKDLSKLSPGTTKHLGPLTWLDE